MAEEIMEEDQMPDFVIVTAWSGAGRTEAMHVFEDLGYYCVDNLPSSLLADLVRVNESTEHEGGRRRLAVVCDSPQRRFLRRSGGRAFLHARGRRLLQDAVPRCRRRQAHRPLQVEPPPASRCAPTAPPFGRASSASGSCSWAFATAPTTSSPPPICCPRSCAVPSGGSSPRVASARDSRSPCTPSASSTALPTTPTSSWTCASCRTPITIRSCGR